MPRRKSVNLFYALVGIAGTVFVFTAVAYGVMTFLAVRTLDGLTTSSMSHPLLAWLAQHGTTSLMVELAVLAVATVAAIGTDEYRQRRIDSKRQIPADAGQSG